jgi:hypothetical protein
MVSVFALLVGIVSISCAQIDPNGAAYDELKRSGQLPLTQQTTYTGEYPDLHHCGILGGRRYP